MSSHPHPPSAQLAYRQWVSRWWVVNQIKCCFPCVLGETHVALVSGASKMASRGKTLGLFSLFSWSGSFVSRCFVFSVHQGVSCHCSLQLNSNRTISACASYSPNPDKALCAVYVKIYGLRFRASSVSTPEPAALLLCPKTYLHCTAEFLENWLFLPVSCCTDENNLWHLATQPLPVC